MSDTKLIDVPKDKLKDLTKVKEFEPTPAMIVWLDTAMQLESDSPQEIENACKITRQSWYGWIKDEQFNSWFNEQWNKRLRGHAWRLDAIGFKNAKRDFKYWEKMQQRVGNLQDKGVVIDNRQQFNTIEFVKDDV